MKITWYLFRKSTDQDEARNGIERCSWCAAKRGDHSISMSLDCVERLEQVTKERFKSKTEIKVII